MGKSLVNVFKVKNIEESLGEKKPSTKVFFVENHVDENGKVEKRIKIQRKPKFTFHSSKDEYKSKLNVNFIEEYKTDVHTVEYDKLDSYVAKLTKQEEFMKKCIETKDFKSIRNIHAHPDLHFTDVDLEDYKIREWVETTPKEEVSIIPLRKAFFDIEVDSLKLGRFPDPEEAKCPITMISYFHQPTMEMHSFLLIVEGCESQNNFLTHFEDNVEGYCEKVKKEFNEEINKQNEEESSSKKNLVTNVSINLFDDELELIKAFFEQIHADKPDYALGWNLVFDLLTIQNRILRLGEVPEEIMCPKSFPFKKIWIEQDLEAADFSSRKSKLEITGYTQYLCMQESFASIRATAGKKDSYKLEDILMEELGEGKFEYEGEIAEAMYVNYESFAKYSMYDSFRIYQLEDKIKDVDLLHGLFLMTCTRVKKVMTKTTSIRNFAAKLIKEDGGFILSNNINRFSNNIVKEKFKGAWVAELTKMKNVGIPIFGKLSKKIFEDLVDLDLTSLYPSIILSFFIDANIMIGRIEFNEEFGLSGADIASLFSEGDAIKLGSKLLDLPTFEDLITLL